MGWKAGSGLGAKGQGRIEPVPLDVDQIGSLAGVGRLQEEHEWVEKATEGRRLLETEMEYSAERAARQQAETEKRETIEKELREVNKVFLCETCNKQYTTVGQYQNHLSSYDHHHKKRLKEMQERERSMKLGSTKKKEEKALEKEMKRMMQHANANALKTTPAAGPAKTEAPVKKGGFKPIGEATGGSSSGGFAPVEEARPPSDAPKKGGFKPIGEGAGSTSGGFVPVQEARPPSDAPKKGGFKPIGEGAGSTSGGFVPVQEARPPSDAPKKGGFKPIGEGAGSTSGGFVPVQEARPPSD
eukprot:Colp12_sorted_trinity150504_noHs@20328